MEEEEFERDSFARAEQQVEKPPHVSAWWWLAPPVYFVLRRRRDGVHHERVAALMRPEELEAFAHLREVAGAWAFVAAGASQIAAKELHEQCHWAGWTFWALVVRDAAHLRSQSLLPRSTPATASELTRPALVPGDALVRSIASVPGSTSLDFYDSELRAHHEHLRAAYGIGPGDEVLDIGCGTGLTTRDAARAAAPGRVVGVDVSEPMLRRARELTAAERLANVRYERGDAQVHRFDSGRFDAAISRFGTMFFTDPVAAFANIAGALRGEARLVLLVWQRLEHNEWARLIDAALGAAAQPTPPGADPFSLGDAEATARILESAGFDDVRFEDVREPVLYGPDLDAALTVVTGFQNVSAALASLSDGEAARTVERLREVLAAHHSHEHGVVLDSRSWLITARRRR